MMSDDQRPTVGVAHVVMHTDRMAESAGFMRTIGMRSVFDGSEVSVFELRGGTHLILMATERLEPRAAAFDLMVDDLREMHRRLGSLGFAPSAILARAEIDHEVFSVREPSGNSIEFFSSHASGKPV